MLYTYSITPLLESGFDELVMDIKDQVERGISIMPLFKFVPIAEGTPVWDKIGPMCKLYAKYKAELDKYGIKSGVLLQSTIGHGWNLVKTPFQRYINLTDGAEANNYCPEDENFLEHLCHIAECVAKENPDAIMIDDDFRLTRRSGKGCACPKHLEKFNSATGKNYTREQLWEYIDTHPMDDEINEAFLITQRETLINTAKKMREAIDKINPSIQGITCATGDECNIPMVKIAKIFAGKGNPSIVRMHNGVYAPITDRCELSKIMHNGAIAVNYYKQHGIDVLLAEADTIPFNRYAKSARFLHSQLVCSVLEGMTGAKHWYTRFGAGELKSGKAYRDILAKHKDLYEKLADFAKDIKWVGANQLICDVTTHWYKRRGTYWEYLSYDWTKLVFERMGLPFYYSTTPGEANLIEGEIINALSDEKIEKLLAKTILTTSMCAKNLADRGYEEFLGVKVEDKAFTMGNEVFNKNPDYFCTRQKDSKLLVPLNNEVEELSHICVREGQNDLEFYPAVTRYKNKKGGSAVVYSGTPLAEFKYTEGFAFLNETRKKQFIEILKKANALPVYADGDDEILLRAGVLNDGRMLVMAINLGFDPVDEINLYFENEPKKISMLLPDGTEKEVSFTKNDDGIFELDICAEPLYPLVLLIK